LFAVLYVVTAGCSRTDLQQPEINLHVFKNDCMLQKTIASLVLVLLVNILTAQTKNTLAVSEKAAANTFPLFSSGAVCIDTADDKVVGIAADCFVNDVQLVSGKQMQVVHQISSGGFSIVAGTAGKSKLVDDLITSKQLNVSTIKNKWECFVIKVISKNKLVIAGSDPRGTAYGLFHLSKLMGVSPWVWWADAFHISFCKIQGYFY
jgi:hypothetical protein